MYEHVRVIFCIHCNLKKKKKSKKYYRGCSGTRLPPASQRRTRIRYRCKGRGELQVAAFLPPLRFFSAFLFRAYVPCTRVSHCALTIITLDWNWLRCVHVPYALVPSVERESRDVSLLSFCPRRVLSMRVPSFTAPEPVTVLYWFSPYRLFSFSHRIFFRTAYAI